MCGTLKLENQGKRLGSLIPVSTGKGFLTTQWGGFIQEDSIAWWNRQSHLMPGRCYADGFIEGKFEFKLPIIDGQKSFIQGLIVEEDVFVHGKKVSEAGAFKIITRGSRNLFEAKIHPRWPLCRILHESIDEVITFGDHNGRSINNNAQMRLL